MEVHEQKQKRNIEEDIEPPSTDPTATRLPVKMIDEHPNQADEAGHELKYLKLGDSPLPLGPGSERGEQVVSVHDHVDGGVGGDDGREERLGGVQPEVAHDQNHGVVVHMEESEAVEGATDDDEERVHELIDFGEVENVSPEEKGPGRRGFRREADDPERVGGVGEDGD